MHIKLLSPLSGFCSSDLLYGSLEPSWEDSLSCSIVALDVYALSTITLTIRITQNGNERGSLYCYIPFHGFNITNKPNIISLNSLVDLNCPNELPWTGLFNISNIVKIIKNDMVSNGNYIQTIDWSESNELAHLLLREDGYLGLYTNKTVKFGSNTTDEMPKYLKCRAIWKI